MIKGHFLWPLLLLLLLSSCASHVMLTGRDCRQDDELYFNRTSAKWYSPVAESARFRHEATVRNFGGDLLQAPQKYDVCEMLYHQQARELRIKTSYTITDFLLGLIPGYAVRTVEVSGIYSGIETGLSPNQKTSHQ